jgi:hypothetical protein
MKKTYSHDELVRMTDDQIEKPIPREWRPFYPDREIASLGNRTFYVREGESWDIEKRQFVEE